MTLDAAIREDKTFLKKFIRHYEQELNNKDFTEIYKHFDPHRSIWVGGATEYGDEYDCRSFTALLLKNNINPLKYMDEVPEYFAFGLDIEYFVIPNNVTRIRGNAFYGCDNLKSVTIPKNIKNIYTNAFKDCESLTDVYYEGSEEDWKKIKINPHNDELLNATIHYNS